MENYTITVARGFGSGGKEIASQVAKDLGIHCYENRILTLASQMSGIDRQLFEEVNEKLHENKRNGLITMLNALPRRTHPEPERRNFISDEQLFAYETQIILELAKTESCIIVGKCADWILKDNPRTLSLYIEASRTFCRPRIMKKMGVTAETADISITETDKYRAEYYAHYTNGNYWTNPVNYDLTLNSERLGIDRCVELIEYTLHSKFPDVPLPDKKTAIQEKAESDNVD